MQAFPSIINTSNRSGGGNSGGGNSGGGNSGSGIKKLVSNGSNPGVPNLPNAARAAYLGRPGAIGGGTGSNTGSAGPKRGLGSNRISAGDPMDESTDSPLSQYHSPNVYQQNLGPIGSLMTGSPSSQQGRPPPMVQPLPLSGLSQHSPGNSATASARVAKQPPTLGLGLVDRGDRESSQTHSQTTRERMQLEKDAEKARLEKEKQLELKQQHHLLQKQPSHAQSPQSQTARQPVPPSMPSPQAAAAAAYASAQTHQAHGAYLSAQAHQPQQQQQQQSVPMQISSANSPNLQQQQIQQQMILQQQQQNNTTQQQQQQIVPAATTSPAAPVVAAVAKVAPKPKPAMTPAETMKKFSELLTPFEQSEILEYQQIYFVGVSLKDKIKGIPHTALNNGYDDDRGDYKISMGDHLEYRYEVLNVLGRGSFGQVLKVFDHKKDQVCALKIIRNKKRFHHQALVEVKILEHLMGRDKEHKSNIVRVHGYFYFRNHLCITFEPLSINLYEFIKNNGFKGISLGLIRRFALQLLQSLRFLKGEKIIHCDLKPENILLKSPNKSTIKLIDFGSSCFPEHETRVLTSEGFMFLAEIERRMRMDHDSKPSPLQFAAYSSQTRQIEYVSGRVVFPRNNPVDLIDFTAAQAKGEWTGEEHNVSPMKENNHLSLLVTPDHNMYVSSSTAATSTTSFHKIHAEKLLVQNETVQFLASASEGVSSPPSSSSFTLPSSLSLSSSQSHSYATLIGVFLACGRVQEQDQSVAFAMTSDEQVVQVTSLLDQLHLPHASSHPAAHTIVLHSAMWANHFTHLLTAIEAGSVFHGMDLRHLRSMLNGLSITFAPSSIAGEQCFVAPHASSSALLSQIHLACVHAGYSPWVPRKGMVCWSTSETSAIPTLSPSQGEITRIPYTPKVHGRIWCIQVDHPEHLIVAQRCVMEEAHHASPSTKSPPTVLRASRPMIVGNCFEDERVYTYIQSRFYRSPEVILGLPYDIAIDMWSLGCILSELYTGYPLFPGENETEQLQAIMEILGPPPKRLIQECTRKKAFFDATGKPLVVPNSRGKIRQPASKDLAMATKCNDAQFLSFLRRLLRWDPKVRMTPEKAFEHPWITEQPVAPNPQVMDVQRRAGGNSSTPTQISQVGFASVSMQGAVSSRGEKVKQQVSSGEQSARQSASIAVVPAVAALAASPPADHPMTDSPSGGSTNRKPGKATQPSTARRPSVSSTTAAGAAAKALFPPISSTKSGTNSGVNSGNVSSRNPGYQPTSQSMPDSTPMDTS